MLPGHSSTPYKVWDEGNSTDDVLVAAYERAMDPNQDGSVADAVDVLSFSGGVDYGTLNSMEAMAAQRVVDLGTVFVASAGNSGNQPLRWVGLHLGDAVDRARRVRRRRVDQPVPGAPTSTSTARPASCSRSRDSRCTSRGRLPVPVGGHTDDLFDGRAMDPNTAPTHFCSPLPAGSLTGQTVVVFRNFCRPFQRRRSTPRRRGPSPSWSATTRAALPSPSPRTARPSRSRRSCSRATTPTPILEVLSPNAPAAFNEARSTSRSRTRSRTSAAFVDAMTSFTSEGPARLDDDLKPDISAPGSAIQAAAVGTGNEAVALSGTSMAAPHVSGVAVLLRQLHPTWSPAQIKAVLMNQANRNLNNNTLTTPVPATVMGSGRVEAFQSARARSVAWPGSLSFGFAPTPTSRSAVRSFVVKNFDNKPHGYTVTGEIATRTSIRR